MKMPMIFTRLAGLIPKAVRNHKPVIILATVGFLCFAPSLPAQMRDCEGIRTERGNKVLLDDITYAAIDRPSADEPFPSMERLEYKLHSNIEQLRVESGTMIKILRCSGRRPQNENVFDRSLIEQLDNKDVVLEIWGKIAQSKEHGVRVHNAFLRYVLIPIRYSELTSGGPSGIYRIEYPMKTTEKADEVLNLFDQAVEMKAYVAIGVGINSFKVQKYDLALKNLCIGQGLLSQQTTRRPDFDPKGLIEYIRDQAVKVIQKARNDSSYKGAIKLLSDQLAANPCIAAEVK